MYAEIYGVPANIEEAAKFVQWAQAASRTMQAEGDTGEQTTRYNLGEFWKLKDMAWGSLSPEDQAGMQKLDWIAHQEWGRLADRLQWMTNDTQARARYAAEATEAYRKAAALAPTNAATLAQRRVSEAAANIAQARTQAVDSSYGAALRQSAGNLINTPILGLPAWAWGLGALALAVVLFAPRLSKG